MEAQANTTREQSNKKNIYDVGWRPLHGKNGGVGKKNSHLVYCGISPTAAAKVDEPK